MTRLLLPIIVMMLFTACSEQPSEQATASSSSTQAASKGEELYTKNCKVCHAQGINGAPILGNQKMWAPRASQDITTLVQHASEGFGLMPAKGGNTELTDDDLQLIIEFMLSALE